MYCRERRDEEVVWIYVPVIYSSIIYTPTELADINLHT